MADSSLFLSSSISRRHRRDVSGLSSRGFGARSYPTMLSRLLVPRVALAFAIRCRSFRSNLAAAAHHEAPRRPHPRGDPPHSASTNCASPAALSRRAYCRAVARVPALVVVMRSVATRDGLKSRGVLVRLPPRARRHRAGALQHRDYGSVRQMITTAYLPARFSAVGVSTTAPHPRDPETAASPWCPHTTALFLGRRSLDGLRVERLRR